MVDIAIIMPVIAAIGAIIIVVVLLIVKGIVEKEQIRSIDRKNFNQFVEELREENTEMKKDIQVVKEKVQEIDKMMKDI